MIFDKGRGSRVERIVLIGVALFLWAFAFYPFLSGEKKLIDDAKPYYEHVKYYLDNLSQGVYPLWDPTKDFGVDNEFYLRRIGEFNPAYLGILLLKSCGVDFMTAHRIFLFAYFGLGVLGFYLLSRLLFASPLTGYFVVFSVVFSTLGTLAFNSYLLLILVPEIWFLYFLLVFFRAPRFNALIGMTFCLMIISITYIPFYFLTVILCALTGFALVVKQSHWLKLWQCGQYLKQHPPHWILALALLAAGFLPGVMWNLQSARGEMSVVYRHTGAETSNAAALHINVVNEGGIVAPRIADKMFFELDKAGLGDFYLPLFVYLTALVAAFVGITRRMVFFFVWGFLVYLIGIADASPLHGFLYQHVFFFKYFRNLQFFLWLGVLPAMVLFAAELFEGLMRVELGTTKKKMLYCGYIVLVHGAAALFFAGQDIRVVIPGTYVAIILSAVFFIFIPFQRTLPLAGKLLPFLLLFSFAVQPMEVFSHIRSSSPNGPAASLYNGAYMRFTLPRSENIGDLLNEHGEERYLNQPFYSSKRFQDMFQNLNHPVLGLYIRPRLLLYDGIAGLDPRISQWPLISDALGSLTNDVFIDLDQLNLIQQTYRKESATATLVSEGSSQIKVKYFGANKLVLGSDLKKARFLVYNNVYHSRWRALIDGRPTTIFRANYAFMGIEVPAGAHRIEFVFQSPWRTRLAFLLELVFVLAAAAVIVLMLRRAP